MSGDAGTVFSGVAVDSRKCRAGSLFIALPGARVDGHEFIAEARDRGAVAALVSRSVDVGGIALVEVGDTLCALGSLASDHLSRMKARVIGVTGSVGKTTTKDMISAVLNTVYRVLSSPLNYNTEVGLPLAVLELEPTHDMAVLEMAMRGRGQISYLAGVARPVVGVITVIGETHLEILGSVENIALAKTELIQALPENGLAILNGDDPWQRRMVYLSNAPVLWYGTASDCSITALEITPNGTGTVFELFFKGHEAIQTPPFRTLINLPLPGEHHVMDALAAAAAGLFMGVGPDGIARGLEGVQLTAMRCEIRKVGSFIFIDDTYNASPTSVRASMDILSGFLTGRRVAVLGDMLELGSRAVPAHREVGEEVARRGYDLLVTVGDLSRYIGESAVEKGLPAGRVRHFGTTPEAVFHLLEELRPGDAVLFKGSRGMRMESIVGGLQDALVGAAGSSKGGETE